MPDAIHYLLDGRPDLNWRERHAVIDRINLALSVTVVDGVMVPREPLQRLLNHIQGKPNTPIDPATAITFARAIIESTQVVAATPEGEEGATSANLLPVVDASQEEKKG